MGIYNPYVLYSWSFLLSVGSMLSILMFEPYLRRGLFAWREKRFAKMVWLDQREKKEISYTKKMD